MFRPKLILGGSSLAMVLASGTLLSAQATSGTLSGVVKDDKGAPVSGATVTLSSPALFAPRVAQTNEKGEWRSSLLPVGNYKVVAVKNGYVTSSAEDVRVGLGAVIHQDLVLKSVAASQATVVVVATAATVDKSDTKSSTNYSAEQLQALPGVDRSFAGSADLAPGLVTGVNGSFSVRGGATQNTLYTVNGSSVKDDYQGDLTGTFVIEDNIEDTQVILSPLNARNGRALGGAVNVVTKSGGNDFKGSIRASIGRDAWGAFGGSHLYTSANGTNDDLNRSFQVTLSGPIWKDKVWFSLGTILTPVSSTQFTIAPGYNPLSTRPIRTGIVAVDNATGTAPAGYVWGASNTSPGLDINANYNRQRDDKYYEGKLTGAISADHTVALSYSKRDTTLGPRNPFGDGGTTVSRLAALGQQKEEQKVLGLEYRGVLSSSLFIEARYNKVDTFAQFPTGDPKFGTGEGLIVYSGRAGGAAGSRQGLTQPFGQGITPTPDARNNRSGNVNLKWYADLMGSQHEFDFGYDYYEAVRGTSRSSGLQNEFFRVGGMYFNPTTSDYLFPVINWMGAGVNGQDATGLRGPAPSMVKNLGHDGTTKNRMDALYVNDQWTVNTHWNVMLGVRTERHKVVDTTGAELAHATDMSPRLQVRYDLNGDSKHLFTATAARFYGDFTIGFTDAFVSKADSTFINAGWSANAANPGAGTVGSDVNFVNYATLTNPANYQRVFDYGDSSKNNIVDGSLKSPNLDEFTIGYKRSYDNGSNVSLTYVHRTWKNDWAFSQDYLRSEWVTLHDPSGQGNPDKYTQTTHIFNSSVLKREYNGLEFDFKGKISSTWTWGGNYTYSRLVGNSNGGDQPAGGQTFRDNTPNSVGPHYQTVQLSAIGRTMDDYAPTGPLANNQSHRARLYATAEQPLGQGKITYSWLIRYDSGNTWSASNAAPLQMPTYVSGVGEPPPPPKPATYTQFYGGRGQYSFNDTYQVDFRLAYDVPLGISSVHLFGDLQINNLFNTQMQSTWNTSFAPSPVGQNQLFVNDASPTGFGTNEPNQGVGHYIGARSAAFSIGLKF